MMNDSLIAEIVELELEMFLEVRAEGTPSCREAPDEFRLHRSAQFSVWRPEAALQSYCADLREARKSGRNLMTYKYARMDELIAAENDSPLIDEILKAQTEWQRDVIKRYPKLMRRGRGLDDGDESELSVSFVRYMRAELESYSERTLELLCENVRRYEARGENMSEKIYLNLAAGYGLDSLEGFKE